MKNYQKGIAPIIIALIIAVIFGGGYMLVKQQQKSKKSEVKKETSDWKTYKNDNYGFEIQLPSDWEGRVQNNGVVYLDSSENFKVKEKFEKELIEKNVQGTDAGPKPNITITYYKDQNKVLDAKTLEEYVNTNLSNPQKISFAGQTAFRGKDFGLYIVDVIFIEKEKHLYMLGLKAEGNVGMDSALGEKILSTFKFTSSSATSDWKTYSNNSLEFKYPSLLSVKQEAKTETVTLSHSIAYKHPDSFCDFKGDTPVKILDNLLDFNISITLENKNLKELVQSTAYPGWDYVSANPYKLGSLSGYKVSESIEGCGKDVYYFTLSSAKTLVVDRSLTEFNQGISILPGVIDPGQAEKLFEKIITSIKAK